VKTAIYARVSTRDQNPENQLIQLKEYVENNKDMELFGIYEDIISGVKDTRPDLDKLMIDARLHKFNHVVLWKVDRLGRSPLHMFQVIEEWKKLGISFTVTTLGIDTSTPMGHFVFGLLAQVAELERQFNIERTQSAMDRIKKSIEKKGYYITKDGKKITSIGRPKGRRDNKPRRRSGYYLRHSKKGSGV